MGIHWKNHLRLSSFKHKTTSIKSKIDLDADWITRMRCVKQVK